MTKVVEVLIVAVIMGAAVLALRKSLPMVEHDVFPGKWFVAGSLAVVALSVMALGVVLTR